MTARAEEGYGTGSEQRAGNSEPRERAKWRSNPSASDFAKPFGGDATARSAEWRPGRLRNASFVKTGSQPAGVKLASKIPLLAFLFFLRSLGLFLRRFLGHRLSSRNGWARLRARSYTIRTSFLQCNNDVNFFQNYFSRGAPTRRHFSRTKTMGGRSRGNFSRNSRRGLPAEFGFGILFLLPAQIPTI